MVQGVPELAPFFPSEGLSHVMQGAPKLAHSSPSEEHYHVVRGLPMLCTVVSASHEPYRVMQ